jgi:hypothetical protein
MTGDQNRVSASFACAPPDLRLQGRRELNFAGILFLRSAIIPLITRRCNEFLEEKILVNKTADTGAGKIHLLFIFAPDRVQSVKSRCEYTLSCATQLFSTLFFTELLKTGKKKWK